MSRNLSARLERLEQQSQGDGPRAVFLQIGDKAKPLTGYAVGRPVRQLEGASDSGAIVKRGPRESEEALLERALEAAWRADRDPVLKLSELRGPLLESDMRAWTAWRL